MSQIADYFSGKSAFITGGTGFLGRILVFKLLTACPGIENVYLLIRPKKGKSPEERLKTLFSEPAFAPLEENDLLRKVRVIPGDVTSEGLGMTSEDEAEVISKVEVIFHSAATVKFDEDLTKSVAMNVGGTKQILELAKKVENLSALIHVSTAYCNCQEGHIREEFYPMAEDPNQVMEDCAQPGAEDLMNNPEFTKSVIGKRPNTYTFTKALAEKLVLEEGNDLPMAIIRPSIVVAALNEPLPGWVDNLNGPTGMIAGAGMGLLRSMYAIRKAKADIIPVDIVINMMIALAAYIGTKAAHKTNNNIINRDFNDVTKVGNTVDATNFNEVPIYNCTTGFKKPITWGQIESEVMDLVVEYPMEKGFWYPRGTFKETKFWHQVAEFFFHYLVGLFADSVARLFGQKPRLGKVFARMKNACNALEAFVTNEWTWFGGNNLQLLGSLSDEDRALFDFDIEKIDWSLFIKNYVLGTRNYVLKNDPNSIEECRNRLVKLHFIDIALKAFCILLFGFFLSYLF